MKEVVQSIVSNGKNSDDIISEFIYESFSWVPCSLFCLDYPSRPIFLLHRTLDIQVRFPYNFSIAAWVLQLIFWCSAHSLTAEHGASETEDNNYCKILMHSIHQSFKNSVRRKSICKRFKDVYKGMLESS